MFYKKEQKIEKKNSVALFKFGIFWIVYAEKEVNILMAIWRLYSQTYISRTMQKYITKDSKNSSYFY